MFFAFCVEMAIGPKDTLCPAEAPMRPPTQVKWSDGTLVKVTAGPKP